MGNGLRKTGGAILTPVQLETLFLSNLLQFSIGREFGAPRGDVPLAAVVVGGYDTIFTLLANARFLI